MKKSDLPKMYSDDENVIYDVQNSPFSIFDHANRGHVLDDEIVFGRDYPTGSFDYDTYNILYFITDEPNLDSLFEKIELKTAHGEGILKENLFKRKYIRSLHDTGIKDDILKMNPQELSNFLKMNGINASGKRKKLVKIALENISSLNLNASDYEITENGEKFLEDYKWIELYDLCLKNFEFDDFYKFIDENPSEDMIKTALLYLDFHTKHAHECMDFGYLCDCINGRTYVYLYSEDSHLALSEEIRYFILRINPIYDYEEYYSMFKLLDYVNINNLKHISKKLKIENLYELFSDVWDSMDLKKEFISKKEAYEFLEKLFDHDNFDDLCDKYYKAYIVKTDDIQSTLFDF